MLQSFDLKPLVLVTVNFYKADADGNPRFNEETGARFWTKPAGDGSIRCLARVDQAQHVYKTIKGTAHDISPNLIGTSVEIRLSKEDYKLLKSETKQLSGIGATFLVELSQEPMISRLDIKKSKRGRNGKKASIALIGEIMSEEILPATAKLIETGVAEDIADVKAALAENIQDQVDQAKAYRDSRATNEAAESGLLEAETGALV